MSIGDYVLLIAALSAAAFLVGLAIGIVRNRI